MNNKLLESSILSPLIVLALMFSYYSFLSYNELESSSSIKEGALRKLISIGNIGLKSDIDYTKIENVKCN